MADDPLDPLWFALWMQPRMLPLFLSNPKSLVSSNSEEFAGRWRSALQQARELHGDAERAFDLDLAQGIGKGRGKAAVDQLGEPVLGQADGAVSLGVVVGQAGRRCGGVDEHDAGVVDRELDLVAERGELRQLGADLVGCGVQAHGTSRGWDEFGIWD